MSINQETETEMGHDFSSGYQTRKFSLNNTKQ